MSAITLSRRTCGSAAAAVFKENGAGEKQVHRHTKVSSPPSVSTVQKDIIGMWRNSGELFISDVVGRSHGDVNSDSLLVQPERCRVTKKHRQE